MYLQLKLTHSTHTPTHLHLCARKVGLCMYVSSVRVSYLCCERDWKYEMQQMCLLKWSKWKLTNAAGGARRGNGRLVGVVIRSKKSWLRVSQASRRLNNTTHTHIRNAQKLEPALILSPAQEYAFLCMSACELCVKFNVSVTKWRAATMDGARVSSRRRQWGSASRASFPSISHFPLPICRFPACPVDPPHPALTSVTL